MILVQNELRRHPGTETFYRIRILRPYFDLEGSQLKLTVLLLGHPICVSQCWRQFCHFTFDGFRRSTRDFHGYNAAFFNFIDLILTEIKLHKKRMIFLDGHHWVTGIHHLALIRDQR